MLTLRRGQVCLVLDGEGRPNFEELLRPYIETCGVKVLAEISRDDDLSGPEVLLG